MYRLAQHILCFVLVSVILLQSINSTLVLSDYQLNKDFITKMFCINKSKPKMHCNGKCHLKKELNKAEKQKQSPVNPINEKQDVQLFSHAFNFIAPGQYQFIRKSSYFTAYQSSISEMHAFSVFHPPQL